MHLDAVEVLEHRLAEIRVGLNEKIFQIERLLINLHQSIDDAAQSIATYESLRRTMRTLAGSPEPPTKAKK